MTKKKQMNPPLSWLGGKRLLREKIIEKIPKNHELFAEVCCGAAWVTFGKEPSKYEALNDADGRLTNFYNVVKTAPHELVLELQWDLVARETFQKYLKELENEGLSNVQRAARFYYLIKTSFGSQGKYFGVTATTKPRLNLQEFEGIIFAAHERLKRVSIENLDWREFIDRYDRPHTLLYIDPPYRCKSAQKYFRYFKDKDYMDLSEALKGIKGRFILSLNRDKFILKTFECFKIEEVKTKYSISKAGTKSVTELLIMNY